MPERLIQKQGISTPKRQRRFPDLDASGCGYRSGPPDGRRAHFSFYPTLLVSPHDEINSAVRIYAAYTFSRDLALAFMLSTALLLRARATLNSLLPLTGFIQLLDAFTDVMDHRWVIVPAALVIGRRRPIRLPFLENPSLETHHLANRHFKGAQILSLLVRAWRARRVSIRGSTRNRTRPFPI